jgi:glutamine synthetase
MLTLDDLDTQGYDTIILAAPDIQGRLFGRRIPLKRFLAEPEEGVDICTCALAWTTDQSLEVQGAFAGWQTGWQDFRLIPDLSTLRPYPGSERTVICLADAVDESGTMLEIAPRTILRRQLERATALGFDVLLASELEFYLFKGSSRVARQQRFRNLEPTTLIRSDYSIVDQAMEEPFIAAIRQHMDAADIPVFACQAEYGFGQWEINLDHASALEMADRHVIYKAGVKEMAMRADLAITFMPKPVAEYLALSAR